MIDIAGGENKTRNVTTFFEESSNLKKRLGKVSDKLIDVLLESYYICSFAR